MAIVSGRPAAEVSLLLQHLPVTIVGSHGSELWQPTIADNTDEREDYVWVHDYQLNLVADQLMKMGVHRRTGFFLHIPFPPLDGFIRLPWCFQILNALLQYDLVGFQTIRDRRNFLDCVRMLVPGAKIVGHGQVVKCSTPAREMRVGAFPISIDCRQFAELAGTQEVKDLAWIIHANLPERQLILGVDRLDYTKGIPHRLYAFANTLERYPEMRRRVTLVQVIVPSRNTKRSNKRSSAWWERSTAGSQRWGGPPSIISSVPSVGWSCSPATEPAMSP